MKRLVIQRVKYKNLLASGDSPTKIDFTRNNVTVVTGNSGSGKSTITEALCYALYGRSLRKIPKNKLVNRKNGKALEVEVDFMVNNTQYKVKRTVKPDTFDIICDGQLLNQDSSSRDYQAQLDMILGMNFNMFLQTVIISKTKYTPFVQLDSSARRAYVESVLNLNIFGDMLKLHSKNVNDLKTLTVEKLGVYRNNRQQVETAELNVTRLANLINSTQQQKVAELEQEINTAQQQLDSVTAKYITESSLIVNIQDPNPKLSKLNNIKQQVDTKIGTYSEQLTTMLTDKKCYACGQVISDTDKNEHVKEIEVKIEKHKEMLPRILSDIAVEQSNLVKYAENTKQQNIVNDLEYKMNSLKQDILRLQQKVKTATATVDYTVVDDAKTELVNYRNKLQVVESEYHEILKTKEHYDIVTDALKDSGIKTVVVQKYLPLINHVINQNLSNFGFFVNFELDSTFTETIKLNGVHQLEYYGFSEGEKLRIDMSILMAWREITQMYTNMSCNLLIFDEMADASLDYEGSNVLSSLLATLENSNVFVITHTPEKLENIARSAIKFEKVNGYSHIV